MIATGHDDGSVRLWDSSGLSLSILHKLKTHKLIDRRKTDTPLDASDSVFRVTALEVNGNLLGCASAGGLVTLYHFNAKASQNPANDELADIPVSCLVLRARSILSNAAVNDKVLEIPVCYESGLDLSSKSQSEASSSAQHFNFPSTTEHVNKKDLKCCFRTKIGFRKQFGFQPELLCLLLWSQRPPDVKTIKIYPKSSL